MKATSNLYQSVMEEVKKRQKERERVFEEFLHQKLYPIKSTDTVLSLPIKLSCDEEKKLHQEIRIDYQAKLYGFEVKNVEESFQPMFMLFNPAKGSKAEKFMAKYNEDIKEAKKAAELKRLQQESDVACWANAAAEDLLTSLEKNDFIYNSDGTISVYSNLYYKLFTQAYKLNMLDLFDKKIAEVLINYNFKSKVYGAYDCNITL